MAQHKPKFVRRIRPRVVVLLGHGAALQTIVELAREWEWNLLDLEFTRGSIPDNPSPRGAFIQCLPTDPLAKRLTKMGCPAVRLGRLPHPQDRLLPAILPDQAAAGRLAADHFADRGFKNVAFIAYDPSNPEEDCHALYEGFKHRAGERDLNFHLHELIGGDREHPEQDPAAKYERRSQEVGGWLAALPKPVGVFTYDDVMAARVCTMCLAAGLAVPEEVAVLGVGNNPLTCELSPVHLSSIDTAVEERGKLAALLLRSLMHGKAPPAAPIMVPPRSVVQRRSTDVLAVDDPSVAGAMRFMWDHLEQSLSVKDIAQEVGVGRRHLERAFRHHLGRGINAELRRKRLERCCEVLRSTTISITDLAPRLGFRSADYLHSSFRQAFGMTPRTYRMRNRVNAEVGTNDVTFCPPQLR